MQPHSKIPHVKIVLRCYSRAEYIHKHTFSSRNTNIDWEVTHTAQLSSPLRSSHIQNALFTLVVLQYIESIIHQSYLTLAQNVTP